MFNVAGVLGFGGIFASMNGVIPLLGPFMREREKRLYNSIIFFLISTLYHLPIQLLICAIYQVVFFWVIDIRQGFEAFWKYYILFFMTYITAAGFGDILSISIRKIEVIMQTFPLFVVPLFMVSGFIAEVKSMVFYLIGFSYLSFFKFSFQAGIHIEFYQARAEEFQSACPNTNNDYCNPFSVYDFYEDTYWLNILFLLIQSVFFRIISSVVFWNYVRHRGVPYEEMPPSDTFRIPKDKGKHFNS